MAVALVAAPATLGTLWFARTALAGPISRFHDFTCETNAPTRGVACTRTDDRGFAVFAGAELVAVRQNSNGKIVYDHANRGGRKAKNFPFTGRTLVGFGVIKCTAKVPEQIGCARSDGIGFGVVITKRSVSVVRLVDGKRVFHRANP